MKAMKLWTSPSVMMVYILGASQSYAQSTNHSPEDPLKDVIMPMHESFIIERKNQRGLRPESTFLPENTNSEKASRTMEKYYYNPLDHFKRGLDVLSSSWWVRLREGDREPETRRSHAAAVFAIHKFKSGDGSDPDARPDPSTVDPSSDVPYVDDQQQVAIPPSIDDEDLASQDPAPNDNKASDEPEAQSKTLGNDSTGTPTEESQADTITDESADAPKSSGMTNSSDTDPLSEGPGNRNLSDNSLQEYMIITGGFTDTDWDTFPVWAYDMTSATLDDDGRWYELTPPSDSAATCATNVAQVGIENALPCAPASRVGHISIVREGSLYVFGGLEYDDHKGVFIMDEEPYMYSMLLSEEEFGGRDYENYNGNFDPDATNKKTLYWKKWLPNVKTPSKEMQSSQTDDLQFTVNRGEVRGAYWEKGDKLIIYGGLHVRHYDDTNTGRTQQADTTLGDVWAYDFKSDTWEMMASTLGQSDHPGERTSHAATVIGDELVVYGGLRKVDTNVWDGTTVWSQLDDVWIFNLDSLSWKPRLMTEYVGRAYHAVIGWSISEANRDGAILASFGGFKTMMDPVDNQQISYVYDDTMVSMPQFHNVSLPSAWFLATYRGLQPDTISTRLEHSAVLSARFGNMIVWGGRYRLTSDIGGVWSLNIAGEQSAVQYLPRSEDSEIADPGMAYVLLVTVMMMSMMFTYMCGVVHRRLEGEAGANLDAANGDPSVGNSVFGRNGLGQDIIDTIPLKKYQNETEGDSEQESKEETQDAGRESSDSMDFTFDDDEDCCPICLVEYEVGDDIRCLPCGHEFHKSCVDPWLANNASCPACRHSLSDLVSLTTSATFAAQIRATISTRMRPTTAGEPPEVQNNDNLLRSSPDQAIAPGIRGYQHFRRIFSRRWNEEGSVRPSRSNAEDDEINEEIGDLELSYSSSLELSDGNSSNDNSFDSDDVPVEDRSRRRRRMTNTGRQRLIRGHVHRRRRRTRGQARSPLNAPLQPSDASIV